MFRRARFWSFIIVAGAASLAASACGSNSSAAGAGGGRGGRGRGDAAAAPVVTAKVTQKDVPVDIAAIGNVEAYASISVRSQVTGQITEIAFHEGDSVRVGQLLFSIDRRPFEAALAQADANLLRDKALLAQAEAQLTRDAANAEYMQISAERQTAVEPARHHLEGRRRTDARVRGLDGGGGQGRQSQHRKRAGPDCVAAGRR